MNAPDDSENHNVSSSATASSGSVAQFDPIQDVVADIKAGKIVIVTDDEDRENEGDLIFAAEKATPELLAFTIRYTSGVVCVPMLGSELDRLKLPLMMPPQTNTERLRTAYTISVDAAQGVSTGISAADRAHTIRLLASPQTQPEGFARPGHVFPLRYREGGVLRRAGHTEAAVDLVRLAGLRPCGVLAEVANDDGTMSRLPELMAFRKQFGLKICTIQDLIAYRCKEEKLVEQTEVSELQTACGRFTAYVYRNKLDGRQHLALVKGLIDRETPTLVRVQQGSLINDVFAPTASGRGTRVQDALAKLAQAEAGVLVYLVQANTGQLLKNMAADAPRGDQHASEDAASGRPTTGSTADLRDYGLGAQILHDLGVRKLRLLTNQPRRVVGLEGFGIELIDQVSIA
ncbi:MAG: 3,4-dihydroxy-2-butanone-4-phosphate synthase [Rhodospirillales bacterium]|nr:3,4-dihydroxy-2-butanone-4-phosphate synthase [Acetobacter sp.]